MEALVHGTSDEAMEAIREAIDYKVFCRVEPSWRKQEKRWRNRFSGVIME